MVGALAAPFLGLRTSRAQHAGKIWRVGYVAIGTREENVLNVRFFEERLANLGYRLGHDIQILYRFLAPQPKSLEDALVTLKAEVDLLLVRSTIAAVIARKIAPDLPTVFLTVGNPLAIGLVQSLARPGGNMTGVTFEAAEETYGKRLQILKEIVPSLRRAAVLRAVGDPNVAPSMASLERTAPLIGIELMPIDIKSADDLETAFAEMRRGEAGGLIVIAGALMFINSQRIAELALAHHLPSIHGFRETVAAGGLVSLGPDIEAMSIQGAAYIDKIIKGANPGDLPVEQPSRYELSVNAKTARALQIELPPSLVVRADEIVD
jgi:putative ABC transport system substrate-binding protein